MNQRLYTNMNEHLHFGSVLKRSAGWASKMKATSLPDSSSRRASPGRPHDTPGRKTSARIFDSAMRLFYERGYEGTTIRDISDACGLTPAAIYNHYRSKDDILWATIKWGHDELDRDLRDALAAAGSSPIDRLSTTIHAFVLRHTRFREAARVTNREYGMLEPRRRALIVERRRQTRAFFQSLINAAASDGGVQIAARHRRAKATSTMTAMAVINMVIMIAEWYRTGGPVSAEAVARHHASLVVAMIRGYSDKRG